MRTLEDICDKNIGGSSVLEYANRINPMLFQKILEAFGKECPLVYDVVESLVILNPRSRNILKTNSHKILCGLQTLGFISNIRNSKTVWLTLFFLWSWQKSYCYVTINGSLIALEHNVRPQMII